MTWQPFWNLNLQLCNMQGGVYQKWCFILMNRNLQLCTSFLYCVHPLLSNITHVKPALCALTIMH